LTPFVTYYWRVNAKNSAGTTAWSPIWHFTTTNGLPPAPALLSPPDGALDQLLSLALQWTPSLSSTSYRIQLATDSLFASVVTDDSTLADTSLSVGPLTQATRYYWHVMGKNDLGWGAWSDAWSFKTQIPGTVTTAYSFRETWNLLSVPLEVPDWTKDVLFPTATSPAYSFDGAYVEHSVLSLGTGYWLKFADTETVQITGVFTTKDTLTVVQDWNLIGSIAISVPVTSVAVDPPELVLSRFFEYNGQYIPAQTIQPGRAYWVKASGDGKLILNGSPKNRRRK
jgi:hypothetical protein